MTSLLIDNAGTIASTAISLLQKTAEDWKQVVPEAHDFQRECQHFLNIIYALKPTQRLASASDAADAKQPKTKLAAAVNTVRITKVFAATQSKKPVGDDGIIINDSVKARSSDSEKREIILDDEYHGNGNDRQQQEVKDTTSTTQNGGGKQRENGPPRKSPVRKSIKRIKKQQPEDDHGVHAIIREIMQHITAAKRRIDDFITENNQRKKWYYSIRWFFKRAVVAAEYRAFFKDESAAIRSLLNDLVLCQKIAEKAALPRVDDFKNDMSEEPYLFWKKHMGQRVVANWSQFIDSYALLFGTPEPVDLAYIERMLKAQQQNSQITVYAFISFTRKHGFPFQKNIVASSPETEPALSEEGRMEVTKMVMQMVHDFSEPMMQDHLLALYGWFKGLDRNDVAGYQRRADEWARLLKESRNVEDEKGEIVDKEQLKANRVDKARRAVSFFYQRYMVMWRVGKVSRETIKDVDFPGRHRIKDFIRVCAPLDKANYRIIIGKKDEWETNGKPKVYTFLEMLLKEEEKVHNDQAINDKKKVHQEEEEEEEIKAASTSKSTATEALLNRSSGSKLLDEIIAEDLSIKGKGKDPA